VRTHEIKKSLRKCEDYAHNKETVISGGKKKKRRKKHVKIKLRTPIAGKLRISSKKEEKKGFNIRELRVPKLPEKESGLAKTMAELKKKKVERKRGVNASSVLHSEGGEGGRGEERRAPRHCDQGIRKGWKWCGMGRKS